MARFIELTALCKEKKSNEELQLEKTLNGEVEDIYLPGFEEYRVSVNLDAVIAFNEGDSNCKNDCTVVDLDNGSLHKVNMLYDDFKSLINNKS